MPVRTSKLTKLAGSKVNYIHSHYQQNIPKN